MFKTDANEFTIAGGMSNMNEEANFPGGIIGFQLSYTQVSC